jgi:F-box/leucine-rich repeat protein 10/11
VLQGVELIWQTLCDDLELIHDPYLAERGDEKSAKKQKAAREAVPVHHVGMLPKAGQMLSTLQQRIGRARTLVDAVADARQPCMPTPTLAKAKR